MTNWSIGNEEESQNFAKYRKILYEIFPEARLLEGYGDFKPLPCGGISTFEDRFILIDRNRNETNVFLSKGKRGCPCRRRDSSWEVVFLKENGESKYLLKAIRDAKEKVPEYPEYGIIYLNKRYVNKRMMNLLPEAMDIWLRDQFGTAE